MNALHGIIVAGLCLAVALIGMHLNMDSIYILGADIIGFGAIGFSIYKTHN